MSKNVFIVNCDRKTFESSFSKKKNSDIINQYYDKHTIKQDFIFRH